jgi:hypothetical protein
LRYWYVWSLFRVLRFGTGEAIALPMEAYDSQKAAIAAKEVREKAYQDAFAKGMIVLKGEEGGYPLTRFLVDLGIADVSHSIAETRVIPTESSPIIVSGVRH